MNRRDFIQKSLLASAAIQFGFIPDLAADSSSVKLTILHTNDTHSRIDPFPLTDSKFGGMGGIAKRAALIEKIRQQETNVLLLDAGDLFQGTPYFNFFNGEVEVKAASSLGYEAVTMGNHDFDAGLEGFIKQLPNAKYDILVANYVFEEKELKNTVKPYKIFVKSGIRIGVFGLGVEPAGLVPAKLYGGTKYIDPIGTAQEIVQELHHKKCDLVICLSHLGYEYAYTKVSDKVLAAQTEGIDLIIGGHTHTFLTEPQSFTNKKGGQVYIAQVGWAGINLGKIDVYFTKQKRTKTIEGTAMIVK
jgi:5'-nucleotidase